MSLPSSSPNLRRTDSAASQAASSSDTANTPAPAELKRTFTDFDFYVPPIDLTLESDSDSDDDKQETEREIWIRCDDERLRNLVTDFMSRHHVPSSYTGHLWLMDELVVLLDKKL